MGGLKIGNIQEMLDFNNSPGLHFLGIVGAMVTVYFNQCRR
jgi:hypothetical protein